MISINDLIAGFSDLMSKRHLYARTEGDCHQIAIRAANFIRKQGGPIRIYRRQGKIHFRGEPACCRKQGGHEWLEIPSAGIQVLDFAIAYRLRKDKKISPEEFHRFAPIVLYETLDFEALKYDPDPYRKFEGLWEPNLQAFGWHPVEPEFKS